MPRIGAGLRRWRLGGRGILRVHVEQLDVELETGLGGDVRRAAGLAVAQGLRDDEAPLAAHLHADDAPVPALDDRALAEREVEGGAAVARAVELRAVHEGARVVHAHEVARLGDLSGAHDVVDRLQLGGAGIHGSGRSGFEVALAGLGHLPGASGREGGRQDGGEDEGEHTHGRELRTAGGVPATRRRQSPTSSEGADGSGDASSAVRVAPRAAGSSAAKTTENRMKAAHSAARWKSIAAPP